MNELISISAASEMIRRGVSLSLAGPESALDQLPAGNWIGGTASYFMVDSGGTEVIEGKVFVTNLSDIGNVRIACYGADQLSGLVENAPENGFSVAILPAGGRCHQIFGAEAADNPDAFLKPTVGWISGVHLSDLGRASPKVYDGRTASKHEDKAVVAYVELPASKMVSLEILNLFEPGDGDVLHFNETSFHIKECEVNGKQVNFAHYLREQGLSDGKLPLVGTFAGAHINASLQSIDDASQTVHLYAPVFPGVDYHFAKRVPDYAGAFRARLADVDTADVVMGCNCILNYLYGDLQGKAIGGMQGPITFGEIAYQLLNQTMVMVRITE
jgi:hypothetical protein